MTLVILLMLPSQVSDIILATTVQQSEMLEWMDVDFVVGNHTLNMRVIRYSYGDLLFVTRTLLINGNYANLTTFVYRLKNATEFPCKSELLSSSMLREHYKELAEWLKPIDAEAALQAELDLPIIGNISGAAYCDIPWWAWSAASLAVTVAATWGSKGDPSQWGFWEWIGVIGNAITCVGPKLPWGKAAKVIGRLGGWVRRG